MMNNEKILLEAGIHGGEFVNAWRINRTKKLINILGKNWFKNKSILELGCGFGNIGLYLKSLGADVTLTEVVPESIDIIKVKDPSIQVILLNQEEKWKLDKNYDLIIHFALLNNLNNWKQDLACALEHTNLLVLDAAVTKFSMDSECKFIDNYGHKWCGAYAGIGSLPSSYNIEKILLHNGFQYTRFDDSDLNTYDNNFLRIRYDWVDDDSDYFSVSNMKPMIFNSSMNNPFYGGRRFWIARRI